MEFIDRINQLCKERKISKRQLEREAGLGAGSSSKWKTFTPNNTTMTKLANYFGVSISYLTGESEYKSEQEAMWDAQYNSEALSDESTRIEKGCRIPVIGQVVAGIPIGAIEEVLDWEEIPFRLAQTGEFFGLQVKGVGQRTLRFLFPRHTGPGGNHGSLLQSKALPPPLVVCHRSTFFSCFS